MDCHQAETLIFAERDGAVDTTRLPALAEHLAGCASCRHKQAELAHAARAWRQHDALVETPRVEGEWHAIRRRIRAEDTRFGWFAGWQWPAWLSVASATAAVVLAIFLGPRLSREDAAPARDWTYVSYVEVDETAGPTIVYEDPQSGWLVVWVTESGPETDKT